MVFGILALATGAFYTALIAVTQIDHIFFPDGEIRLGRSFSVLPGVDSEGTSGERGEEEAGRRINLLVMGLDRRASDGDAASRTDTMFVMTIDPTADTARGLALPRDLWVEIPIGDGQFIENRINAAYPLGETQDLPGDGIGTVRATVEHLLGLRIDHHVMIDFEGFREIVNLLGGIEVEVPVPGVNDPFYSETELPGDYYPCVFEGGTTYQMDGSQALCYARVRRNSNDLDRILRQQRVILAMMDKASQLQFLSSPEALVNLWQNYKDTIQTDVGDLQAPGYARMASQIDQNSLAFLTLGVVASPWTTPEGAQVLLPSEEGVAQLVEAFLADNRLIEENPSVEVQNGTGEEGQGNAAVDFLVGHGLARSQVTAVDQASQAPQTEIIVYGAKDYSGARIAEWLGLSPDRVRQSTAADESLRTTNADIVVLLASDANLETSSQAP